MVNNIIAKQNEEQNLLYLAAQRNLYSKAENWVKIEFIVGGLLIGILYLFVPLFSPTLSGWLNLNHSTTKTFIGFIAPLLAFIFTIVDLRFINPEINTIKLKAALIQEKFDCTVLSLPWNDIRINHPEKEEIIKNANDYKVKKKDLESLKNWYEEPIKKLPLDVGRILAQRTNCWWDSYLRENFIKAIEIIGLVIIVVIIIFTLIEAVYVKDLIINITTFIFGLFSFLYYYVFLLRQLNDNNNSKDKMSRLKQKIDNIWELNVLNSNELNLDILSRQIQDELFDNRKTAPIVFDFFYNIKKNEQEVSTEFSVKERVDEYFSKKNI